MVQNIASCKAKQPNSRGKQSVLTAVVFGEAHSVDAPVVLEPEAVFGIVEIRPAKKPAASVVDRHLCLGAG